MLDRRVCTLEQKRTKKSGQPKLPAGDEVPRKRQGLFEFFGEDGELQLGLGERLYNGGLGVFGGGVA